MRKTQEVPSGHNPADYVTRRVFAPAWDGETVPVSLLYRKDTPLDGSAPCLLYGYGSYGIAIPAAFSTNAFSLVDRGFVYALAHIRGGKDKGYRWYKDGKLAKKTNTFKDFISAGHYLAEHKFTSAGRIVGQGGSAGGMLMGAVANMAPELFAGIIADVPFVDVLTPCSTTRCRSRRRNGPSGATPSKAPMITAPSRLIRPTIMYGRKPIRTSSRRAV